MELILTGLQAPLVDAWQRFCGDLSFVSIHHGSILDVDCDAVVSPANSFGFMNGGIDLLYSRHFGWQLQERLQGRIRERHHGELLVGAAEVVETGDGQIPYLIAAPTMRMPLTIRDTVNPYLAARAICLLWKHGTFSSGVHAGQPISRVVQRIAMPGLGTGVGSVEPEAYARQVRAAIDDILLDQFIYPESWGQVMQRHELLVGRSLGTEPS